MPRQKKEQHKEAGDTSRKGDGAKKDSLTTPKVDLSLVPYEALEAAAIALKVGEKKYGRYNYELGHPAMEVVSAALRHLTAWAHKREECDPKDGQPHLGSVIACVAMILRQQALGTLKDNRPKGDGIEHGTTKDNAPDVK